MAAQPGEAVPTAHAHLDQRPAVDLPGFAARLHAHDLIARDSDPLLDNGMAGRALPGQPRKFPDFPPDRYDLEIRGALTPDHADGNRVACCAPCGDLDERTGRILVEYGHGGSHRDDGFGERRNRCPAFTLCRSHELITYVARRNDMDGKWQDVGRSQPVEMVIDRLRFPASIGEYRAIGHRADLAMGGHQRQGGRLYAGAER